MSEENRFSVEMNFFQNFRLSLLAFKISISWVLFWLSLVSQGLENLFCIILDTFSTRLLGPHTTAYGQNIFPALLPVLCLTLPIINQILNQPIINSCLDLLYSKNIFINKPVECKLLKCTNYSAYWLKIACYFLQVHISLQDQAFFWAI